MTLSVWGRRFRRWKRPLSKTEAKRCVNALKEIKQALRKSPELKDYKFKIRTFGSYRNKTNLRTYSDIDVYVAFQAPRVSSFWGRLAERTIYQWIAPPWFSSAKRRVQRALERHFKDGECLRRNDDNKKQKREQKAVDPRTKAIGICKTPSRVGADVLVCAERTLQGSSTRYIEFWPKSLFNLSITSWPEHHRRKSIRRNREIRRYKTMIRIFKGLRLRLKKKKAPGADKVSSYMIECLLGNVPPSDFDPAEDYMANMRNILTSLRESQDEWFTWQQVNRKQTMAALLGRDRRKAVSRFIEAAWNELGFETIER